jgi:hypothetical protein
MEEELIIDEEAQYGSADPERSLRYMLLMCVVIPLAALTCLYVVVTMVDFFLTTVNVTNGFVIGLTHLTGFCAVTMGFSVLLFRRRDLIRELFRFDKDRD